MSTADSLQRELQQPGIEMSKKSELLVQLVAEAVVNDPAKGLAYGKEALRLAHTSKNKEALAFTFSYLVSVNFMADEADNAKLAADSAIWYAGKIENKLIKGLAYYKAGWLQNLNNEPDSAVESWQKALDFLEAEQGGAKFRAAIYYAYFGIYAERGDIDKEQLYAQRALQEAHDPLARSVLGPAWQINGTMYLDRFDLSRDTTLLDSALFSFKKNIELYLQSKGQAAVRDPIALSALFIAQIYMDHYPPWAKDSVLRYVGIALANADTVRNKRMLVNCNTILSNYALQEGRLDEAERMLVQAKAAFGTLDPPDYYVGEMLYRQLADLAEQKGEKVLALQYYKQYVDYYKKQFDARQMETIRRLDARYQGVKKDKEIQLLKEQETFRRKQNFFYLGILIAALFGLVFMFRAYHFRLRYSLQREKFLRRENEEANLKSELKEQEAARLALEKQEAELQSQLRAEEAARLYAEQQLLKAQQEQLQKELLAGTLQVEHKNELLYKLKEKLSIHPGSEAVVKQLDRIVHEEALLDEDFEKIKSAFKDVHPQFFDRLQQKADGKLTSLDLKYCAYIYMKLSGKQIAALLHIEPKSVRMGKYRIKQKLGLGKEVVLEEYMNEMKASTNDRQRDDQAGSLFKDLS